MRTASASGGARRRDRRAGSPPDRCAAVRPCLPADSLRVGAVSDLRHIKHAISTARLVMQHTRHSMLAGLQATQFAYDMGQPLDNLTTKSSALLHKQW